MKAFTLIFLFGLVATVTWSCSDSLSSNETVKKGITLQTTQSSYAPGDTVTAVLQNGSSSSIEYGNPFQVQKRSDGKWTYIGPSLYFTLEAYIMNPGGQTTYRFALADSLFPDHPFSGGQYRVTTNVGIGKKNPSLATPPFQVRLQGEH